MNNITNIDFNPNPNPIHNDLSSPYDLAIYLDKHDNMIASNMLTQQAKNIIDTIDGTTLYANEIYRNGDCDDYGPTEHFWTLYLVVENNENIRSNLKFYREVYDIHGDDNNQINYCSDSLNDDDNRIFVSIHELLQKHPVYAQSIEDDNNNYDDYHDDYTIDNMEPSELTIQGKITLEMVQAGLAEPSKIVFIAENDRYGDYDKDGPLEYMWDLYIFIKNNDGSITKHKFYREFHYHHNKEDMDDIPYEEDIMNSYDEQYTFRF